MDLIQKARTELAEIAEMERRLAARRGALEALLKAAEEIEAGSLRLVTEKDEKLVVPITAVTAEQPLRMVQGSFLTDPEQIQRLTPRALNAHIVSASADLLARSAPMKTAEILAELSKLGLEPNTKDKAGGLSTILGRSELFEADRLFGWTLAGPTKEKPPAETGGG